MTSEESREAIRQKFMKIMDTDKLDSKTFDDYVKALEPENPIERIGFRLQVSNNKAKDFIRLEKGTIA